MCLFEGGIYLLGRTMTEYYLQVIWCFCTPGQTLTPMGQVDNTEMPKPKYENGSTETEVRK